MNSKPGITPMISRLAALMAIALVSLACGLPGALSAAPTATVAPTLAAPPTAALPTAIPPVPTNTRPAPANIPTDTAVPPDVIDKGEPMIYMVAVGDGGQSGPPVGCGDSLVPIKRNLELTRQPILATLNLLFSVKTQYYGESGLYNALYQSNLMVESAGVDANGLATVRITGTVMMGGECDTPRFKGQIEQSILSNAGVKSVNVILNGKPIDEALSLK